MGVADRRGYAFEPVVDRFGVLDKVGQAVDYSGDQDLVVGQRQLLENVMIMCGARGGEREEEAADISLLDDRQDIGERHIAIVRTLVIAPADMQTHLIPRNVVERGVDRRDDALNKAEKVAERPVLV